MATLRDVARLACVTDVSTVPRALNNTSCVHPDTRARIWTAAKEPGYHLDIILDPIFIMPRELDMGAAGTGLATFLSNFAACMSPNGSAGGRLGDNLGDTKILAPQRFQPYVPQIPHFFQ